MINKSIIILIGLFMWGCSSEPEVVSDPEPVAQDTLKFTNYRREVMLLKEKRLNNEEKADFQDASRFILKTYDEWKDKN